MENNLFMVVINPATHFLPPEKERARRQFLDVIQVQTAIVLDTISSSRLGFIHVTNCPDGSLSKWAVAEVGGAEIIEADPDNNIREELIRHSVWKVILPPPMEEDLLLNKQVTVPYGIINSSIYRKNVVDVNDSSQDTKGITLEDLE